MGGWRHSNTTQLRTRVDMFGIQRPAAFGDVLLAAEANIINKKQDTYKI